MRDDGSAPGDAGDDASTAPSAPVPTTGVTDADAAPPGLTDTEPRRYIEIRPGRRPLAPGTAAELMTRLAGTLHDAVETGRLAGLRAATTGGPERPRLEWLWVADGQPDARVRYLVGCTDPDLLDDVQQTLTAALPADYELRQVRWHPQYLADGLPMTADEPAHESITPAKPYAAGMEFRGHAETFRDWQCPLRDVRDADGHPDGGQADADVRTAPLAHLLQRVQTADAPLVAQVVVTPQPDWTARYDEYRADLESNVVTATDRLTRLLTGHPNARPRLDRRADPDRGGRGRHGGRDDGRRADPLPTRPRDRQPTVAPASDDGRLAEHARERLAGLRNRVETGAAPETTLRASIRAVALTRTDPAAADETVQRLRGALRGFDGPRHELRGHLRTDGQTSRLPGRTVTPGWDLFTALVAREVKPLSYERRVRAGPFTGLVPLRDALARAHTSAGIVMTPGELAGLCLVDGASLSQAARRALGVRPVERTGLPLPPPATLRAYRGAGQALVEPLDHDRRPYGRPLVLPPGLQRKHLLVGGATGHGKSVLLETALLTNAAATDGPEILLDYKGDDTSREYLQAHYATYGDLEDVIYLDLTTVVPALAPLSMQLWLETGLARPRARDRVVDQYTELLAGLMGHDRFHDAAAAVDALRDTLRVELDIERERDAISHTRLYTTLLNIRRQGTAPEPLDENLRGFAGGVAAMPPDTRTAVFTGALLRARQIQTDGSLGPLFDHRPPDDEADPDAEAEPVHPAAEEDEPWLDLRELLDQDKVLVLDFGGLGAPTKRALTLVFLNQLWTALQARSADRDGPGAPPQVNVYLGEAGDVADTQVMDTLLSQGRSFGVSLALGVQYPTQLTSPDAETATDREALNEAATMVMGNVTLDRQLKEALATGDEDRDDVAARLRGLDQREWVVRPAAPKGAPRPAPFLARSLPAPQGHPESDDPLDAASREAFDRAFEQCRERSHAEYGLTIEDHADAGIDLSSGATDDTDADTAAETGPDETAEAEADDGEPEAAAGDEPPAPGPELTSLLPHTERLPDPVSYDADRHAIQCDHCGTHYDPSVEGILDALRCTDAVAVPEVDRDDIPVCECRLKVTPDEIAASDWSAAAFRFLQVVWDAQRGRLEPPAYDIVHDSMVRLREYAGIDADTVDALSEADLLRTDTEYPHRLYSVTPDGRDLINAHNRAGVDHGPGQGDLGESSEHTLLITATERLARLLAAEFDIDQPTVQTYEELPDGSRLDVAVRDATGDIRLAFEAERINNDVREAAPADFDKMAACDPDAAVWVVPSLTAAATVTDALHEPADGEPRIDRSYSRTTPTQNYRVEAPGLTDMYTLDDVLDRLDAADGWHVGWGGRTLDPG